MIYLDNAATSFVKPCSVKRAVIEAMGKAASPGRGGYREVVKATEIVYRARESLAELFGVSSPERIVFTNNATTSINTAIKGVLTPGDSLIISSMEHNAVLRPSKEMEKRGVRLKIAQADKMGRVSLEDIEKNLKSGAEMICLIHGSNVCGAVNDIEKVGRLSRKYGAIFMVDAAQSAGCRDIDVEKCNIDILCFPGHKGLFGPQGTGGMYIRNGIEMLPLTEGGTGSMSESFSQPEILPDKYESGTHNVPGIAGLGAGCRFILKYGAEKIGEHERNAAKILAEDLSVIKGVKVYGKPGDNGSLGVVSITTPLDCVELSNMLANKHQICVRAGLHCAPLAHKTLGTFETGTVRFSPGIFTGKDEIKIAAKAVEKCLRE